MSIVKPEWTFKASDVAGEFDRHVREQLPWYDIATGAMAHVARHYLPRGGRMIDVGCATGNVGRALADVIAERDVDLIGIDDSPEMAERYAGPGRVVTADAAQYHYAEPADLIVSFLTLMFVPVAARRELVQRWRSTLRPGGGIIVFDKRVAGRGYPATALWRLALAGKVANGVDAREIVEKELSLRGVQRPICPSILQPAVEFFRFGEFSGWLMERPE